MQLANVRNRKGESFSSFFLQSSVDPFNTDLLEFFFNSLTSEGKSKSGMVTRDTLFLIANTFPDLVVKIKFSLLHLRRYSVFSEVSNNTCLTRGSNGNILFINTTGNVFVASCPW